MVRTGLLRQEGPCQEYSNQKKRRATHGRYFAPTRTFEARAHSVITVK